MVEGLEGEMMVLSEWWLAAWYYSQQVRWQLAQWRASWWIMIFPKRRVDTATWAGYYVGEVGKNIIDISFMLLGAQQMQPVVLILDKLWLGECQGQKLISGRWQYFIRLYKSLISWYIFLYFTYFYSKKNTLYFCQIPREGCSILSSSIRCLRFPLEHFAFCSLSLSFVCSTGNCADQSMCHHLERNSGAQSTWTILDTLGCSSHMLALVHAISIICKLSQASDVIINYWALHSIDQQFKSPSP